MSEPNPETPREIRDRFNRFRRGTTAERMFRVPHRSPNQPDGFCFCDASWLRTLWFYLGAGLLGWTLKLPFNHLKLWWLRNSGAQIGKNVYISAGVWIDPLFPELLTIEDDAFLGFGTRIALHEYRQEEFCAGRVIIRKGALLGGFSLIGCGVEIGEKATVAGGAVVGQDVPPGATALGNPARIVQRRWAGSENAHEPC